MKLDALLKKRQRLEAEITKARDAERRKAAVADLAERAGLLALPDEILLAEFHKIASSVSAKPNATAATSHT